jgi:hypothetical protein
MVLMMMQAEAALASLDPEELPGLSGIGHEAGAQPEGRHGHEGGSAEPEQAPLHGHKVMPSMDLCMVGISCSSLCKKRLYQPVIVQ